MSSDLFAEYEARYNNRRIAAFYFAIGLMVGNPEQAKAGYTAENALLAVEKLAELTPDDKRWLATMIGCAGSQFVERSDLDELLKDGQLQYGKFTFDWNGFHTVSIYNTAEISLAYTNDWSMPQSIDVLTVGDAEQDRATQEEIAERITIWLQSVVVS